MPVKSKRSSTSFKPISREIRKCKWCSSEFSARPKERKIFCGNLCSGKYRSSKREYKNNKTAICIKLSNEGKTIREISELTGFPPGSISSCLNRAKYRKGIIGQSETSLKNKLKKIYKKCKICQFDRIIEIAHIIPAHKGGKLTEENTIGLCPNHHHLFDNKKLLKEEAILLSDKVNDWENFCLIPIKKEKIIYVAEHINTGKKLTFNKLKDVKKAGFDPSTVYRVFCGKYEQAYGYKWTKQTIIIEILK